jgi:hypothetical protein
MPIPTEPIGSIPRPPGLLAAMRAGAGRPISDELFHAGRRSGTTRRDEPPGSNRIAHHQGR